jgi:hypothetical protein
VIERDVLAHDRAPGFEAANRQWRLVYSPGLYASLWAVAERFWDALGVVPVDRFWDLRVSSLSRMAMRIEDGELKREILIRLNDVVMRAMTVSASGSLGYSIAWVPMSTMCEELPVRMGNEAAMLFIVPKSPALMQALESAESPRAGGIRSRPHQRSP